MKKNIEIPAMGESITEAVIGNFLKADGSFVRENDEIVEIETEKVNQALYAPASGVLHWSVAEGASVSIGTVIGYIDTEAAAPQPVDERQQKSQAFVPQSPKPAAAPQQQQETRKKMSKIRQTIAKRLVGALHEAAMLTTFNEVDMSAIIQQRKKYQESFVRKHGVKLGFMSFFVKAVVESLKAFPAFNAYLDGEEIVYRNYYNIGIAVGTDKGLVVPVIKGADLLDFAQIEQQIASFAEAARGGKLSIADLEGGGFTITNGGVYGSLLSTPILNPPQVGILGMHKIVERPIAQGQEVVVRPMMYLALSYDHRIVDGKEAVSFLVNIKEILEDPSKSLSLEGY